MKALFTHISSETEKNNDVELVTLIANDGSAPRKTGAQMLVGEQGLLYGTIGGGAVELKSIQMAQELLHEKRSSIHEFRLYTNEQEDIGMICGGNVTAYFQYIGADDVFLRDICGKISERLNQHQGGWFIQKLNGEKPALTDDNVNVICGEIPEDAAPGRNLSERIDETFWMPLPVEQRAVIFGGGHVAASLVPLLKTVSFRSWVLDDRAEMLTEDRFPQAEKRILCDYNRIADAVTLTPQDYVVVITNGHKHDFEAELYALRNDFAYLGVIGSRRKVASVNQRLRDNGISETDIAKVHSPIGTAIKAVTPEEIAVSIAGEMIMIRAEIREAGKSEKHPCPVK